MISNPVMQWALTAAFTGSGAYVLLRLFVERALLAVVGYALHLLMCAAMIAMCWPWGMRLPALPQLVFFAAATAWFVVLYGLQLSHRIPGRALGGHGASHQLLHGLMMLAMVWMSAAMSGGESGSTQGHQHGAALPVWAALTGVLTTGAMLVAGVILSVEVLRHPRRHQKWLGHTGDLTANAVMSFGMAAMCWPMITG